MHQTRNGTTEESSSHLCPSDKPSGVQNCIKKACHLNWMAGPWSQVSQYLFKTQNASFCVVLFIIVFCVRFLQRKNSEHYSIKRRNYYIMPFASKAIANAKFLSRRHRMESKMAFSFPLSATIVHTCTMCDDCHSATIDLNL